MSTFVRALLCTLLQVSPLICLIGCTDVQPSKKTPLNLHGVNDVNAVSGLIQMGAEVDGKDTRGYTPLLTAVSRSYKPEVIERLIQAGANVNTKSSTGGRAIHLIMAPDFEERDSTRTEIAKLLIENGVHLYTEDPGDHRRTPIEQAILLDSPELTKTLLDGGASAGRLYQTGRNPLNLAAKHNSSGEITRLLIERGAPVALKDDQGSTALMHAIKTGAPADLVKALIESGSNVNEVYKEGSREISPLLTLALGDRNGRFKFQRYATHREPNAEKENRPADPEVIRLLISHGAEVDAPDRQDLTALQRGVSKNVDPAIIKILLEAGADVNAGTKAGYSSLHLAAKYRVNPEIGIALIESGADPTSVNKNGWSPLHVACNRLHGEFAKMLLDRGVDPNLATLAGEPPILVTLITTRKPTVKYAQRNAKRALERAQLKAQVADDDKAKEILDQAKERSEKRIQEAQQKEEEIKTGVTAILDLLLENDVDIETKDANGWTPMMYAASNSGEPWLIDLLLKRGAKMDARDEDRLDPTDDRCAS